MAGAADGRCIARAANQHRSGPPTEGRALAVARSVAAPQGDIFVFAETKDFYIEFRRNTAGEVDGVAVSRNSGTIGQSATAHQVEPSLRIALSLQ